MPALAPQPFRATEHFDRSVPISADRYDQISALSDRLSIHRPCESVTASRRGAGYTWSPESEHAMTIGRIPDSVNCHDCAQSPAATFFRRFVMCLCRFHSRYWLSYCRDVKV